MRLIQWISMVWHEVNPAVHKCWDKLRTFREVRDEKRQKWDEARKNEMCQETWDDMRQIDIHWDKMSQTDTKCDGVRLLET